MNKLKNDNVCNNVCNLISMSGGKDSTATLLKAIEQGVPNIRAVFADTGHEHQLTYEYVDYLEESLGIEIVRIKPDFSEQIENKRKLVQTKWRKEFIDGVPGKWKRKKKTPLCWAEPSYLPENIYDYTHNQYFEFVGGMRPITEAEADIRVENVLSALKPTGIPFLDMALWKGRFPSSKARFCTEELKKKPIMDYQESLLEEFDRINVWVGVRKDESVARSKITDEWELEFGDDDYGIWLYRPILDWTVEDVFAMHDKHGIEPNPLYKMGMGRVGCMPCVMCSKGELKQIGERCDDEIVRLQEWEIIVSLASKRGKSTFFNTGTLHGIRNTNEIDVTKHGIRSAVDWANTSRGGRQFNMFDALEDIPVCTSVYGLCE